MYEMLTGRVPFEADTPVSVALMHMQERAIEPITITPTIPISVNKIVMKAMQKDGNLRYQSASEMLRDLNMAIKNPDGNFVSIKDAQNDFPTQKIPTMEGKNSNTQKKKKERGLIVFIKQHKVVSSILGGILLFIVTILITYFGLKLTQVKDVQIPNLVGKTIEEAKALTKEAKLAYIELEPQFSKDVEAGRIISQIPEFMENYKIKEKTEIKVVISKGQEMTTVPKVVGMKKEEAIATLESSHLNAEIVEETSKTVEEGYVVSQEIKENTEINAGETVKIHVSIGTGIEQVSMPYVIGKTEAEARKMIEDSKLKVKQVIYEEDKTKDDGKVLKQDKEAGSTLDEGTEIIITVNKIEQLKTGKVKINLKSLTGGYTEPVGNTVTTTKKTVDVEVKVGDDSVFKETKSKNDTFEVEVSGIGTITVKVYIDGVLGNRQKQLNLNSTNQIVFE